MDAKILEKYKKAGEISKQVKKEVARIVQPGKTNLEVANFVDNRIRELGGIPSFPTDVSVNEIAAHYCPYYQDTAILKEGDLVKIDMGASVDGYITDTAFTVSLSKNKNPLHEKIIEAADAAVNTAIKLVKPGRKLEEVGLAIQNEIEKRGFKSIKNLSGHTIERYTVHGGISIPNIDTKSSKRLKEGWVIAIEPFPTTGFGAVHEGKSCKVFEIKSSKNVRQHREVLKWIWEEYNTLPFCERNVIEKFGPLKAKLALRDFVRQGLLHEYSILLEESGSLVAQSEHTLVVTKESHILLT